MLVWYTLFMATKPKPPKNLSLSSDGKNPLRTVKPVPQFKLFIKIACPTPGVTPGILGEAVQAALEKAGMAVLKLKSEAAE